LSRSVQLIAVWRGLCEPVPWSGRGTGIIALIPRYPSLYQINTRVWLTEMSQKLGRSATLDAIPNAELDRLAATTTETNTKTVTTVTVQY